MAKLEDLRKGRCSEVGRCYLVTAVTRVRQPLFADWYFRCRMARLLHDEQLNGCVHTYSTITRFGMRFGWDKRLM